MKALIILFLFATVAQAQKARFGIERYRPDGIVMAFTMNQGGINDVTGYGHDTWTPTGTVTYNDRELQSPNNTYLTGDAYEGTKTLHQQLDAVGDDYLGIMCWVTSRTVTQHTGIYNIYKSGSTDIGILQWGTQDEWDGYAYPPNSGGTYTPKIVINTTYHVAFSYDQSMTAATMYVDGVQVWNNTVGGSVGFHATLAVLTIGKQHTYDDTIDIDQIEHYDRALTATEVVHRYEEGPH